MSVARTITSVPRNLPVPALASITHYHHHPKQPCERTVRARELSAARDYHERALYSDRPGSAPTTHTLPKSRKPRRHLLDQGT
jgi:hypothetical protein